MLLWPILSCGIYYALSRCKGDSLRRFSISGTKSTDKSIWYAICVFLILTAAYLSYCFITNCWLELRDDALFQWKQAQTFEYTDWHPYLHTFLFYGIPRLISDSAQIVVATHFLSVAVAFSYLSYTFMRLGYKPSLVITSVFLSALSPIAFLQVVSPIKDTALAAVCIVIVSFAASIALSNGMWLKSKAHIILLGLFLTFATILRHNGLFFTLPFIVILFICYYHEMRKNLLLFICAYALCMFIIKVPLHSCLQVRPFKDPHSHLLLESCGLPFSIMGYVYKNNPYTMPVEAKTLLDSMSDYWTTDINDGSFNSIKFGNCKPYVTPSWDEFATAFLSTIKQDPRSSWLGFLGVTKQVWAPVASWSGPRYEILLQRINNPYITTPIGWICFMRHNYCIGWAMLVFAILTGIFACRRDVLLLCIPFIAYNLITMLFLSGSDARFFFASVVLCLPVTLLALTKDASTRDKEASK